MTKQSPAPEAMAEELDRMADDCRNEEHYTVLRLAAEILRGEW